MKKEKKVRAYTRRTKSGKTVTVKAHTAKYDAAEEIKKAAKKKGAGDELEMRKRKLAMEQFAGKEAADELEKILKEKEELKSKSSKKESKDTKGVEKKKSKVKSTSSEQPFTAAEFKEWYRGTGSDADKKVAKALRAQLGRAGYRKLEDEAIDNYSSRGHLSMFKRVSGGTSTTGESKTKSKSSDKIVEASKRPKAKSDLLEKTKNPIKIDSTVVRRYARDEDIPVKDARKELLRMTPKKRNEHIQYYSRQDKDAKDRTAKIPEGPKGIDAAMRRFYNTKALTGKDARLGLTTLKKNGYEETRIGSGIKGLRKGNSFYTYQYGSLTPHGAVLQKATKKWKELIRDGEKAKKSRSPK